SQPLLRGRTFWIWPKCSQRLTAVELIGCCGLSNPMKGQECAREMNEPIARQRKSSTMLDLDYQVCLRRGRERSLVRGKSPFQAFIARMPWIRNVDGERRNAINPFHELNY